MANADLDLIIKTVFDGGRTRLSYVLESPKAGFSYEEVSGPKFLGPPQEYQAYLLSKIEKLNEGRDSDDTPLLKEEIEQKLTEIGRELYLELFTSGMQHAYRKIRRQGVQSIRIVSDNEPWIPWELIKPYDASLPGDILDDDFLCLQFELTRWLAGPPAPPPLSQFRVRRLACILTATSLPKLGEEKAFLAELAQKRPGVQDASPVLSSAKAAEAFLGAGGVDLLHFAGHGTFDAARPNESALPFPDGSTLRPINLHGPLATRIAQDRPLVFLNACSVGQQGWSLTRLGGWADRWVQICGCGAFVAPLWPVRDSLALEFAKAFYTALANGETFGQAGRSAREHVRKLAPNDPAWLSYSIYADVHGRLALGDSEKPMSSRGAPIERLELMPAAEQAEPLHDTGVLPEKANESPKTSEEPPNMLNKILPFIGGNKEKPAVQEDEKLTGTIDTSIEHASSWIDLSSPIDFRKGDQLRLTIEGGATKILVRFLPQGKNPNHPVGIASLTPSEPKEGIVILSLEEDHKKTCQISVHGGKNPFGISYLGETNGSVTLLKAERLAREKSRGGRSSA